jgi:tripartite-type tricarboxylate transporter receptor subunit TctC
MKRFMALTACATSALLIGGAHAQDYPVKPIRFIVPFAPGGGTDIVARTLGQLLTERLGRTVVIDNRAGAGSTLGTALAVAAPPDGYTMVLSSTSMIFAAFLYKDLPYDTVRDLAPVSMVASQPNLLVVHPSLPVSSVKDLIALAKAKPTSISYASGGNGAANHLATEYFNMLAGIKMVHVPYKGTGPAVTDLLSGQVQLTISVIASTLPHVNSGKLKALGVTGRKRSTAAANIPTIDEAGLKGYEFTTWYGVQLPAKTPQAIVTRLQSEVAKSVEDPKVKERYAANGLDAQSSTPDEFRTLIGTEMAKWGKVIKAANVTVQ